MFLYKGIEKVDYLTYLATFDHLFDVPKDKKTSEYKKYIGALLDYFYDYVIRVKPLLDLRSGSGSSSDRLGVALGSAQE